MTGAIATSIAVGVATAAAGALVTGAFAPKSKAAAAAAPAVAAPNLAPVADDAALQEAKRKSLLNQTARGGRASTILSDASDKLGA